MIASICQFYLGLESFEILAPLCPLLSLKTEMLCKISSPVQLLPPFYLE